MVEANDGSALLRLRGRPHHAGPFINVYNERTLAVLAGGGVRNVCLPPEMPATAIRALAAEAAKLGVTIEVQVFGRIGWRCRRAAITRARMAAPKTAASSSATRIADGMTLRTLEDKPFLTVNGIQTMSHDYLNLAGELAELQAMGVTRFRLSPHSCDMVAVATIFRDVLDRRIDGRRGSAPASTPCKSARRSPTASITASAAIPGTGGGVLTARPIGNSEQASRRSLRIRSRLALDFARGGANLQRHAQNDSARDAARRARHAGAGRQSIRSAAPGARARARKKARSIAPASA